jgi:hypothetical protein
MNRYNLSSVVARAAQSEHFLPELYGRESGRLA